MTEKEFSIALDPSSLPAGRVTFDVTNAGKTRHEFLIIRTDADPARLPTNAAGRAIENRSGNNRVDEIELIPPAKRRSTTVDLPAGRYALICNIPGHYSAGMHAQLTIS